MSNPLITQGTLNRLRASVVWNDFSNLNVVASYLGKDGIRLKLDGESTVFINTMTGAVTSPEPYQMITLTMHLLKTQPLAALYKAQMENLALLGNGVVRPDSAALPAYDIVNCAIESVAELNFSGADAGFAVDIKGYYLVNSSLYNG
ncbi:MAG: hypothetical protein ACRESI_06485 [Gammaproteobacteria bacterium]